MPLLMIEPSFGPLPPERDVTIEGGGLHVFSVAKGQLLGVTDLEGGQPAALWGLAADDDGQFLSPHHTRVFSNSFLLRLGMRLVSNRRRPVMVLGRSAPHLRHDLLMPLRAPSGGAEAVRTRLAAAFANHGVAARKRPDPINLFLDVAVGADGSLTPRGVSSKAGDVVVFRVVMDMALALAAPDPDPELWDRPRAAPLRLQIRNEVADLA